MLDNTNARLSVIVESADKYNRPEGDENAGCKFADDAAVPQKT